MTAISKVVSLFAISAALTLTGSQLFAKSVGGASQVKAPTTSAASSSPGAGDSISKRGGGACHGHYCRQPPPPGHTQPPCRGAHVGPNGVMVQCQ